jgi:branched-chain amino acid transport system ATP-binding protein
VLQIANLEVVYNDVILVLRGLSLTVPDGKIVALLGSNGAGKTTTLRAVSGLLPIHDGVITKGSVTYDGQRIDGKNAAAIVKLGIKQVMEGRRVFAELTVDENLTAGGYTNRDRKGVAEAYDRVMTLFPRLAERRKQDAGTMSGGEQQMLAVARALMSQPKVLMLDEPTTGLAPRLAREAYEALARLRDAGLTLVVAEQQVPLALELASRGYVLENGRIELAGTSDELAGNPEVQRAYLGVA